MISPILWRFIKILKSKRLQRKKFYRQFVKNDDLCFDIGANKGKKSKLFLDLGAQVIAFEPQSDCIKYLRQIKHPNFSFFPYAVGKREEERELHLTNHIEVATLSNQFIDFYKNETLQWVKSEKVQVKTLDSLIKTYGLPNFCKIDTEGFEYEILSSLSFQIPLIEFEFTAGFIQETLKILNILDSKKKRFNYILNEVPKLQIDQWVTAEEMNTILKKLPLENLHGNIFAKIEI